MSDFLQFFSTLREQMSATLSRSDILKPLSWLIGLLLASLVGSAAVSAPEWLMIAEAIMLALSVGLYLTSYVFCLINDRDALRSEKYSLHKMAIEHGMYGDNRIGLIEPEPGPAVPRSISGTVSTSAD